MKECLIDTSCTVKIKATQQIAQITDTIISGDITYYTLSGELGHPLSKGDNTLYSADEFQKICAICFGDNDNSEVFTELCYSCAEKEIDYRSNIDS